MNIQSPNPRAVLVVDDDEDLRDAIAEILRSEGLSASGASSGMEALEILSATPMDLVLLDLMMPEMDGREVVLQMRKRSLHVPVVLVSASRELRAIARELGLPSIAKPFDLDDMLAAVHQGLAGPAA